MEVLTPPVGRAWRSLSGRSRRSSSSGKEGRGGDAPGLDTRQDDLKPGPDLVGKVWKVWKPGMEK